MTPTPYVRPALSVIRAGTADAAAVVAAWLSRLGHVLAAPSDRGADLGAHELLALWAALQRLRPELLRQGDPSGHAARANEAVHGLGGERARKAATVARPADWLASARSFAEGMASLDDAEATAARLLAELDEAELAAWAARRLGGADETLEKDLATCATWLEEHPQVFLPAERYVQAVALGLRQDLPAFDLDLAWTADKFVVLLDDLEEAERDTGGENVLPLPPDLLAAGRAALRLSRGGAARSWLPPLLPTPLTAAAVPAGGGTFRLLRWRSPAGQRRAYLVLPDVMAPDARSQVVRLNLFDGDEPVRGEAGLSVTLAGVPATLTDDGSATLLLDHLRQAQDAGHGPTLRVGEDQADWHLEAEE